MSKWTPQAGGCTETARFGLAVSLGVLVKGGLARVIIYRSFCVAMLCSQGVGYPGGWM